MPRTVLVVDDEPHMLMLLERILRDRTPYQVTATSNALEVRDILENQEYDVILCDLRMPGMDGMDILRYIREHNRREIVILMTAFGSVETFTEAFSLGVFDYVNKPFKKEQILLTIERAMHWQTVRDSSPEMDRLLQNLPYKTAEKKFREMYVRRLHEKFNGDFEKIVEESGMPEKEIKNTLADSEEQD